MKLKDVLGMIIFGLFMAIIVISYKPKVSYNLANSNDEETIMSEEIGKDILEEEELGKSLEME